MRWRWLVVGVLGACSGADEVVPDAPQHGDAPLDAAIGDAPADAPIGDAPADASAPDAMPDAVPTASIGPVQTFDEVVPGPVHGSVILDAAWNGSSFVVASNTVLSFIGLDGLRSSISTTPIDYWPRIACATNGVCLLGWVGETNFFLQRFGPDGTPIDPEPLMLGPSSSMRPMLGATQDGFIAATSAPDTPLGVVRIPFAGPPLDAIPIQPIPELVWSESSWRGIGCDEHGCAIAASDCWRCDSMRLVRVHYDGSFASSVTIPGSAIIAGFECRPGACLAIREYFDGPSPLLYEAQVFGLDGDALSAPFTIDALSPSGLELGLAADDTGFRVAGYRPNTEPSPDRILSLHIGTDGTLGPVLDLMPTPSRALNALACAPGRCLAVVAGVDTTNGFGPMYRARIDGDTVVDTAPFLLPAGNTQRVPQLASSGAGYLVSWIDHRLAAGTPIASLRAVTWSPTTGWDASASTDLGTWDAQAVNYASPTLHASTWDGSRYLVAWPADSTHVAVTWVTTAGTAAPTTIATNADLGHEVVGVAAIACQPSTCLVAVVDRPQSGADAMRLLHVDTPTGDITVPTTTSALPRTIIAFGSGFASIGGSTTGLAVDHRDSDGTIVGSILDAAWPVTVEYTGHIAFPGAAATVVGGRLMVVWNSNGHTLAKTFSATYVPSATVELPMSLRFSQFALTDLAGTGLLTWQPGGENRIYGLRLAADDATPIDLAPFDVGDANFPLTPSVASASTGTSAVCAWNAIDFDPAVLSERLRLVSITPP